MSDEPALLRAILAAPEDDTVRLVYADWLQEHGQPERAEFIRAECEQALLAGDGPAAPSEWECPRYWELQRRASELHDQHAKRWFASLFKAHRGEIETRRGFPYHVALTARKFIDRGEDLFRAAPTIEDVFIVQLGRNMPKLAQAPALAHVKQLTFFETPFHTAEAQHLAASPHLGNLRELEIGFADTQIGPSGAMALANATSIRQLQKLDIGNHAVFDRGAEELLLSDCLGTLTHIDLGNNGLTDDTLATLASAQHLRLKAVDLSHNHLTGDGVSALREAHCAGIERLSLYSNPIGYRGAANLVDAPLATTLRCLHLANCGLDDSCTGHLLHGSWPQLTELVLTMNRFGLRAARALGANRSLVNLKSLSLGRGHISATTARWLGRANLPALRSLNFTGNTFGPKGVAAILAGPLVRTVQTLHLGETAVGDDGARELAGSAALANIRTLYLERNEITDRGAVALAESPHLASVQWLVLRENKIEHKGQDALRVRFGSRVKFSFGD